MIAAESIAGRVRALRDFVGEDLADWLDADPEELERGMGDRGKVRASGQFDLMQCGDVPGQKVWAVSEIDVENVAIDAVEVFAEVYEPKEI